MATIIWCSGIKHTVDESRTEVEDGIDRVKRAIVEFPSDPEMKPLGFAYFTTGSDGSNYKQIALNVEMISSFESRGNDGI